MQSLKLTIAVSLGVLLLTVVFEGAIVSLFFGGAEQAVLDNIHTHFFFCMIGMPATAVANVIGASLRGVGDNKTPLYTTAVLNVVNLILSFLLIFGVPSLGIPKMGIAGAGIAISSARVVSAVFIVIYVIVKNRFCRNGMNLDSIRKQSSVSQMLAYRRLSSKLCFRADLLFCRRCSSVLVRSFRPDIRLAQI